MRCNKCNSQNNDNANFCEVCGTPLINQVRAQKVKKNPLRHNKPTKIKNASSNLTPLNYLMSHKQIWVFVSIFLTLLIVLVAINTNSYNNNQVRFLDIPSKNPIIEAKVFEIASNFACGCGSCNEESLEICKCSYALEERQFIRDYLEQNRNSADIITAMTSKYGGLKSNITNANNNNQSFKIPTNNISIATFADREIIYSAFKCPCGQCSVDELKDCTCNHKNGAHEVKKYIDDKISENQLSVTQIIDLVDKTYGGKK